MQILKCVNRSMCVWEKWKGDNSSQHGAQSGPPQAVLREWRFAEWLMLWEKYFALHQFMIMFLIFVIKASCLRKNKYLSVASGDSSVLVCWCRGPSASRHVAEIVWYYNHVTNGLVWKRLCSQLAYTYMLSICQLWTTYGRLCQYTHMTQIAKLPHKWKHFSMLIVIWT